MVSGAFFLVAMSLDDVLDLTAVNDKFCKGIEVSLSYVLFLKWTNYATEWTKGWVAQTKEI